MHSGSSDIIAHPLADTAERELPGGFRGNARLRDSGDSGPEGEDQKHFSKLLKMRFIKELHKKITHKKRAPMCKASEGFMRDS